MSLVFVPIVAAATIGIDRQHAGLASGLVNMSRQVGGAIGLAILVTVAASLSHGGADPEAGVIHGYRTVFLITAAVSLASAIIATLLPGKTKPVPAAPSSVTPAPEPVTH